jgi:hypothetical protein
MKERAPTQYQINKTIALDHLRRTYKFLQDYELADDGHTGEWAIAHSHRTGDPSYINSNDWHTVYQYQVLFVHVDDPADTKLFVFEDESDFLACNDPIYID